MSASDLPPAPPFSADSTVPDLWLCLRFDQLLLEALRGEGEAPDFVCQQHRVVAVNPQVGERGLCCGMSINQAQMIAPGSIGLERDPRREQQHLQALAHWAYGYTSQVSMGEQCLLLEVGSCLKLFKGFDHLFQQIEQDLSTFALSFKPGVAHTPAAAYVLSFAINNGLQLARDNSADVEAFLLLLGQVAIETLDVNEVIVHRLQGCGFDLLEELLAMPGAEIGQRFGRDFIDYLARLLGDKADPQQVVVPPQPFLLARDFAEPIDNALWIERCTDDMLQQFCDFLRRHQYLCQLLVWRFYNDKRLIKKSSIPLSSRHYSFDTFKRLTDLHLEKLTLCGELMRIELYSEKLLPAQLLAEDLFDPCIEEQAVFELVDQLATRLGADAVCRINCVAEPVPEMSLELAPFTADYRSPQRQLKNSDRPDNTLSRREYQPLWLLAEPKALPASRYRDGAPQDHRGRPLQLIQGPDRIDSHWWFRNVLCDSEEGDIPGIYRDYYIARQPNGRLLWIFYERQSGQWFLQGLFG